MKTTLLSCLSLNVRSAAAGATEAGQTALTRLKPVRMIVLLLAVFVFTGQRALGSDPIGVFARIDKVVLEPNETSPERIQIWGAFCFAEGKFGDQYGSPKRGHLYYKLPADKQEVARKEWADLKSVAGQRMVIGFGTRHEENGRIRKPDEKPDKPDAYPVGWGLARMKDRKTDYEPIKQLLDLHPAKVATKGE